MRLLGCILIARSQLLAHTIERWHVRCEHRVRTRERGCHFARCRHFDTTPVRTVTSILCIQRLIRIHAISSDGSYPTVSSHTGEWSLNPSSHAIDWRVGRVDTDERSGTLEFSVGGDDAGAFFPVRVSFVGQGSISGVRVGSIVKIENGEEVPYSEDARVVVDGFAVV